jgi:hypothetical protein
MSFRFEKSLVVRAIFFVLMGVLLLSPRSGMAQTNGKGQLQSLDQKKIHASYTNGDFEEVIGSLDAFTHTGKPYNRGDSIFIAKYLAVIYTANPATREKGKGYMFRLLDLQPSAKIVDMFVSDEIHQIFERVKEEHEVRNESSQKTPLPELESNRYATPNPGQMKTPEPKTMPLPTSKVKAKKESSSAVFWIAGGVTIAAVTAYYFLQPKKPVDKNYVVPD